jgi:hypothetical protein
MIRALARWAQAKNPTDLLVPLRGIVDAIIEGGMVEGKLLVKVTEAGGTVEFIPCPGYGPVETLALCQETIEWIVQQPNPQKPRLDPRRIMRMQGSFGGYTKSLDHWFDLQIARGGG